MPEFAIPTVEEPLIGTSEGGFKTPKDVFGYQPNPIGEEVANAGSKVYKFFADLLTPKTTEGATTKTNSASATAGKATSSGLQNSYNQFLKNVAVGATVTGGSIIGVSEASKFGLESVGKGIQNTSQTINKSLGLPGSSSIGSILIFGLIFLGLFILLLGISK